MVTGSNSRRPLSSAGAQKRSWCQGPASALRGAPRPFALVLGLGLGSLGLGHLSACKGFFDEIPLENERSSGESGETGNSRSQGTSAKPDFDRNWDCEVALSGCPEQDTLVECSGPKRKPIPSDCPLLCNGLTPVSCIALKNGSHGCWCEEPGKQRVYGCAELERCVQRCGGPEHAAVCVHGCFKRSLAATIRLYGSLVHCAEKECVELCRKNPAQCALCRQQSQKGLIGSCASLRASCDQDPGEAEAAGAGFGLEWSTPGQSHTGEAG